MGYGGKLTGSELRDDVFTTYKRPVYVLVSGIFKQRKTFVDIPVVLNRFSRIGNVFFFRYSV